MSNFTLKDETITATAVIEVVEGVQSRDVMGWLPRETREVPYYKLAGIPGEFIVIDGKTYTVVTVKYK